MTKLTLTNRTFQAKENYFLQTTDEVLNWMQMSTSMKLLMRTHLVLLQLLNPPQLDSLSINCVALTNCHCDLMILQPEKPERKLTQQPQYHTFSTCSSKTVKRIMQWVPTDVLMRPLVPFRGRVRFLINMPKKPAKYGIKWPCLTDSQDSYIYNGYIYTGKVSDGATLTPAERKLPIPSQIPPEFLPNITRAVGTSLYGFVKEFTLRSHVPNKSKAVVLLSSMHHSEFNDTSTGKPEIISFYDATKPGVDALDMKCSNYSTNRKTRRWPLAIFYYILAMCGPSAYVLYNMYSKAEKFSRYEFVKNLGISPATPFMKKRPTISNVPDELRKLIQEAMGEDQEKEGNEPPLAMRRGGTISPSNLSSLKFWYRANWPFITPELPHATCSHPLKGRALFCSIHPPPIAPLALWIPSPGDD
ncbi:hypothetical protein PR048_022266 [Dryococelus australis]|uniref:PiggyBac transposable element-derived protein domain-containing protein n=1 Tax=Dryococelus australis TaxID=614101 RepID=A0ABQ9H0T0_9NEOP|nr:hypothetical protein PR048_022266 [Dryococelus australis]